MGHNAFDFPLPLGTFPPDVHPIDALGDGENLYEIKCEVQFFALSQEEADMIAEGLVRGIFQLADVDCISAPRTATMIETYDA